MSKQAFGTWCRDVVDELRRQDASLFKKVLDQAEADHGPAPGTGKAKDLLEWLRGDEPCELHDAGDTPSSYADFILGEYTLHGLRGE